MWVWSANTLIEFLDPARKFIDVRHDLRREIDLISVGRNYPGTMATADCTTSTQDEGECWEEGLHSLSCSEDEDRGELVCTGLIFI